MGLFAGPFYCHSCKAGKGAVACTKLISDNVARRRRGRFSNSRDSLRSFSGVVSSLQLALPLVLFYAKAFHYGLLGFICGAEAWDEERNAGEVGRKRRAAGEDVFEGVGEAQ